MRSGDHIVTTRSRLNASRWTGIAARVATVPDVPDQGRGRAARRQRRHPPPLGRRRSHRRPPPTPRGARSSTGSRWPGWPRRSPRSPTCPTARSSSAHSVRNRFTGLVTRVVRDGVMAQVEIQAGPHRFVVAAQPRRRRRARPGAGRARRRRGEVHERVGRDPPGPEEQLSHASRRRSSLSVARWSSPSCSPDAARAAAGAGRIRGRGQLGAPVGHRQHHGVRRVVAEGGVHDARAAVRGRAPWRQGHVQLRGELGAGQPDRLGCTGRRLRVGEHDRTCSRSWTRAARPTRPTSSRTSWRSPPRRATRRASPPCRPGQVQRQGRAVPAAGAVRVDRAEGVHQRRRHGHARSPWSRTSSRCWAR